MSRRAAPDPVHDALRSWAAEHELPERWAVAFSGGADSTALLRAAHALWPQRVHALHINHGLQAAAADFERHCVSLCAALGVPLRIVAVDARAQSGQSPEEAARRARYAALAQAAGDMGCAQVWLAHHADDQVETVLLALSRGAGVSGLAAMPALMTRAQVVFARPLLSVAAQSVRDWLRQQQHAYCDDPSNADCQLTRNRIRHQVLPAFRQAFPAMGKTVSRTAAHMAQAQRLLQELAQLDLAHIGQPPKIAALQALSPDRQANVLRHWLHAVHGVSPSAAQLEALQHQILACKTRGHRLDLRVGPGRVVRLHDALAYVPPAA